MWPRLDGLRALGLGTPGEMRAELNALVLAGRKTATAGLLDEYRREAEGLEYPGERLALLDSHDGAVATVEVTGIDARPLAEVPWDFADAEGEGFASVEDWRIAHRRFWEQEGDVVEDTISVVCLAFRLADGT